VVGAIGLALFATAEGLLALLPAGAGVFDVAWRMALCGIGIGLFGPPNLRQVVGATPKHRTGAVGAMMGTNRLTGQGIGAALAALVLNLAPMNANVVALALAAALTTVAACISLARAPLQMAARQSEQAQTISDSIES
jgi:DHA2 family multidrug resistance protein-like MFS transporter